MVDTPQPPLRLPVSSDGDGRAVRRGPMRRFLEVRGWVGGHARPHVDVTFPSLDGTSLVATLVSGPRRRGPAVVLVHGFAAHRRKPAYAALADDLAAHTSVLALDLRGHGDSGGSTTLGDREALDVDAAVRWLRDRGHEQVVLLGASMGATSLLHAVATGTQVDATVVVSAPATLEEEPAGEAMQRLKRLWDSPVARTGMRWGIGVRLVPPALWTHPGHPRDFVREVGFPLLVVHGADDAYFPTDDARMLAETAPRGTLWLEPEGFGHAEDGFSSAFADRVTRAIAVALEQGRFPEREEVPA